MSEEKDRLTDHEYDGIREYDNPLPNWWLVTFFGTIIFAFIYWIHYTSGSGPTLAQELEVAMKEIKGAQAHANHQKPTLSDDDLLAQFKTVNMKVGADVFQARCQVCHGENLQGMIGPNLTDEFWINGKGTPKEVVAIIQAGIPEKGMPAWESMLKEEEIIQVAAFILSKQDSHPANAKEPQGEKVR